MSAWHRPLHPSGFNIHSQCGQTTIWVESDRIRECMVYYQREHLSGIAISSSQGYRGVNLDFLSDYPGVSSVSLPDASKLDISGLRFLEQSLVDLSIADNGQPLELARFSKLEEFRGDWHPKLSITSECRQLRALALRKHKPKSKDLTNLAALPALEDLSLVQSPMTSIGGIGQFPKLKRIELSYLPKLVSIAAVEELKSSQLDIFDCLNCKNIRDHVEIRNVPSLRVVRFNRCGEIPSIGFIEEMPNLEDFRFVYTNVVDGDLRPLLRLRSVGFSKKKHYSHTPEEVDSIIENQSTPSRH